MKVLRPGRQPAEWSKEVLCTGKGNGCKGCYALLLVGKEDLFKSSSRVAGVGSTWFITIRCPECNTLTDICKLPCEDIPLDIVVNLMPRLAWEAAQCPATTATESTPATPPTPNSDLIAVRRFALDELRDAAWAVLNMEGYWKVGSGSPDSRPRLSAILARFDAGEATGQGDAAS